MWLEWASLPGPLVSARHINSSETVRLAYLTGRYPAVSHTFVLREVEALRALGVEVTTLSIHRADPANLLSDADRAAYETTYAVLPARWGSLLRSHARTLFSRPRRYLATLALALRLSPAGLRGRLWQFFYFVEAVILWRECHRRGVRHVHAQFADNASDVAMLIAELGGGRGAKAWSWSMGIHGPVEFYDVFRNRLGAKVARARFVVCISDFGRSQTMSLVGEEHWAKIHVVHCGVDPAEFSPSSSSDRDRGPLEVLTVGRLVNLKGHAVLIHAVRELVSRGQAVHSTIVGDGPARADLERLVERLELDEHVEFTGAIGQHRIRDFYAAADVFCLPSFGEGVPVVLMEAMAMGVPVLTTRIMGIPELVEHETSGLLVRPGRIDELANALERLAGSPDERERMGRAGREKVGVEYDLRVSADHLHGIYSDALLGSRAGA